MSHLNYLHIPQILEMLLFCQVNVFIEIPLEAYFKFHPRLWSISIRCFSTAQKNTTGLKYNHTMKNTFQFQFSWLTLWTSTKNLSRNWILLSYEVNQVALWISDLTQGNTSMTKTAFIHNVMFWDVIVYSLVGSYQPFRGT